MADHRTLDAILQQLEEDVLVADFRWSILVAAACSYRHDSVLRPFPPMLLQRTDVNNRHENTPSIHANGLLEDRDYAAMVSVHVLGSMATSVPGSFSLWPFSLTYSGLSDFLKRVCAG